MLGTSIGSCDEYNAVGHLVDLCWRLENAAAPCRHRTPL